MKLQTIFEQHTDKFTGKWTHYFDVYDRYLQHLIGQEFTLMEIGINHGGSLQVWKKYFGSKVRIIGIDIDPRTMYNEDQIQTFCGSQNDSNFLIEVLNKTGTPDVIIDDGSHIQIDLITSFDVLWKKLNDNGIYIVEDTHTSYSPGYGGGITSPLNFVSIVGRLVNDVNIQWIDEPYTPVAKHLKSVALYDSMVVFEKQIQQKIQPAYSGNSKIPGV